MDIFTSVFWVFLLSCKVTVLVQYTVFDIYNAKLLKINIERMLQIFSHLKQTMDLQSFSEQLCHVDISKTKPNSWN